LLELDRKPATALRTARHQGDIMDKTTLNYQRRTLLLAMAGAAASSIAHAKTYPEKPIKIILPVTPGSAVDTTARKLGVPLSAALGVPFIMENKPGAGGLLASTQIARSEPDGYTLGIVSSTYCITPSIYKKLPFDARRDVQPVSILSSGPLLLVLHPKIAAANLQQLIDLAKARPKDNPLTLGNAGNGTVAQFAAAQFAIAAKLNLMHVPYKGTSNYVQDLLAGFVDGGFLPPVVALPLMRGGKLKAIGLSTPRRLAIMPDVPTLAEAGLPGFNVDGWLALVAPAKVPKEILQRLNSEIVRASREPEMEKFVIDNGGAVVASSIPDAEKAFAKEFAESERIVKQFGIKPD
jgi:tripartite-type tricarboxylate transporter receptor subunit TctC